LDSPPLPVAEDSRPPRPEPGSAWRARVAELVGIDLRSLAVLRVGLGVLILCDLATRAADLGAHYTDGGVLPRASALVWLPVEAHLSVYMLNGQAWFQAVLFGIAALVAAALAAGYRTRAATVLSWYLVFALQARNPAIDHGGDNVLRLMLFWAMFLPLGARWSLDRAAGRRGEPAVPAVVSVGAVAARLQLCFVYWVTAALKWNPAWLREGSAIATALRLDHLSTAWGRYLLRFPRFLRWLTPGTLALEILGPVAAWSPFYTGPVRSLVVLAFVLFHLCGLGAAMRLGSFPWVCAVSWSLFLPEWLWERLRGGRMGKLMDALDNFDRSGEESYRRRASGRRGSPWGRRLADGLAAVLLAYVLLLNLREVGVSRFGALLPPVEWISESLSLHQRWSMFAPAPPADDGWYVVAGRTRGGRAVDPWRDGELAVERPESLAAVYGDTRWTKYFVNLRQRDYVSHRRLFGNYLCRRWNAAHAGPERLEGLNLVFMQELTEPPNRKLPAQPLLLFAQRCPGA
jgi:hypothetical protein